VRTLNIEIKRETSYQFFKHFKLYSKNIQKPKAYAPGCKTPPRKANSEVGICLLVGI
jgi:hypothetical protein